jgi:hypothetical protein
VRRRAAFKKYLNISLAPVTHTYNPWEAEIRRIVVQHQDQANSLRDSISKITSAK